MSLKRALFFLVALVLVVGTVPAGILAYGRLARALDLRVRESLAMAPKLLADRWAATSDVRMMHAREVSRAPGLAESLMEGDGSGAARIVEAAGAAFPEAPVLVGADESPLLPHDALPAELVTATRRGEMPVEVVVGAGGARVVSLAPVEMEETWVGAAGGVSDMGDAEAATLAGLTRGEVLILSGDGNVLGSSLPGDSTSASALAAAVAGEGQAPGTMREVRVGGVPYLALSAPLSSVEVVFLKNLDQELAVLPLLRRTALWSTGVTLVLALVLGSLFAARLARPVGSLAQAAGRLADRDFDAPLERSGIREVRQVSEAFDEMRQALRARLADLEEANRLQEEANRSLEGANLRLEEANLELANRQERLLVLQAELVQRDRLASAGRLLAQLAHEIRNPIASIRNCLEMLRRRAAQDPEAREFADMAIDELLRMHELTERMMDVHRPRDPDGSCSEVTRVAREVASLLKAGTDPEKELAVSVVSPRESHARIASDSLKQVLLNLGLNAREAMRDEGPMEIVVTPEAESITLEVLDRGPGIPEEILPRIFDPFFTTKKEVHGVGLGLFTAEALVRTYGGRITASNRADGPGARFVVELPRAKPSAAGPREEEANLG